MREVARTSLRSIAFEIHRSEGGDPMSGGPQNVELVERLERAYNERDYDTVRACLAADFVAHTPGSEMVSPGVEGAIEANEGGFGSFPDKRTEILEIFGDGDRVVSHVRMTGTNDGGLPWASVPANGKPVDIDWVQISRHGDDGTIQETWAQMDVPKMMVQLGAMPAPEGM
jgi:predicted ester cyclase